MESIFSEHDGRETDAFQDFETLFDTKMFRILRILIPFFPAPYQPMMAVWLRFSQLQYTLSILRNWRSHPGFYKKETQEMPGLDLLLSRLKPCMSPSEYQELARMQNMFSMYQHFKQIEPYLSGLGDLGGDMSAPNIMNLFSQFQNGEEPQPDTFRNILDLMAMFQSNQDDTAPHEEENPERNESDEQKLDE